MKKVRTTVIIVLCILLVTALALGGCSKDKENATNTSSPTPNIAASSRPTENNTPAASVTDNSTLTGTGTDTNSGTGNPIDPETPPSTKEGESASFTGTIVDAGMGQFLVELDSGVSLTVEYTGADVSGLTDSMPGSKVKVTYTGTIDGADTSGMTVLAIEQA